MEKNLLDQILVQQILTVNRRLNAIDPLYQLSSELNADNLGALPTETLQEVLRTCEQTLRLVAAGRT